MGKLGYISLVTIIIIFMLGVNVYAFENEIFKIDIPSDYESLSLSGMHIFAKEEEKSILVYTIDAAGLKKDIATMSKSEIKELLSTVIKDDVTILEQDKEKLGKEKAIKARVSKEDSYMDMYIVVSDKHILLVCFTAPYESELNNDEYLKIKKSFKMKEKTTNTTFLKLGGIAVAGVAGFLKFRKRFM